MRRWLIAVALLAGCGTKTQIVSLDKPAITPLPTDFVHQLSRWTRYCHVVADFDEALTVYGTLSSPEFQSVFAEKWVQTYRLNSADAEVKRAELMKAIADRWDLYIETGTHFTSLNEMKPGKSVWRITLVDDRERAVLPLEVRENPLRRDVVLEFYPYATVFSRGWAIRFPRKFPDGTPVVGPDTKRLAMRFAGPQGSCDLVWRLK